MIIGERYGLIYALILRLHLTALLCAVNTGRGLSFYRKCRMALRNATISLLLLLLGQRVLYHILDI